MTDCRYSLKVRSTHLNIELNKIYTLRLSNTEELDCYNLDLRTEIKVHSCIE